MTFRSQVNSKIVLPISDLIRLRKLSQARAFMDQSDRWDWDRMEQYQLGRLNEIIAYAHQHIPYYCEIIRENGFEKGLKSTSDISRFPLLTKDVIKSNYPDRITAQPLPEKGWRYHKSGGSTTGEPLVVIEDDEASDMGRAAFYRAWNWMNWEVGMPAMRIWGRPMEKLSAKGKLVKYFSEQYMNMPSFNAFRMNDALFGQMTVYAKSKKVRFFYGYAAAINEFCNYLNRKNICLTTVEGVMTTAEMLYPEMRENIEKTLGAKVYNGYGCAEINGIAYQHAANDPDLEIITERVILEIVDEQGRPVPNGEPGMIAITDLQKKLMPLIRYTPGDEGVIEVKETVNGVNRQFITKLLGRTCEIIDGKDNKTVHSYFFARFFSTYDFKGKELKRFQIVQENHDDLDVYLDMESTPAQEWIDSVAPRLTKDLQDYVGSMNIQFYWNSGIEVAKSGKLRWTINKLR